MVSLKSQSINELLTRIKTDMDVLFTFAELKSIESFIFADPSDLRWYATTRVP